MTISWEFILQILTVVGAVGGLGSAFAWISSNLLKGFRDELLVNAACRHDTARRLTDRRLWGPYRFALAGGLRVLNRRMGESEQWGRGFRWCLAMAFVYPVVTLVVAWGVGIDASIGDTDLLERPDTVTWWLRALVVIWIAALALAFTGADAGAGALTIAIALALAIGVAMAGASASALALAGAGAGALAVAIALALALAGAGAGAGAGAIAGMLWLADSSMNGVQITAIALFWFVLPWLNAAFDFVSWQVSRRLGRHLLRQLDGDDRSWFRRLWDNPIMHMIVDVVVACFLLAGLAWALPAVIRLYNRFIESFGSSAPLVLDGYLCDAARDPLGAGIWATVMLISTLVPTLIHLGFVFASPFIAMFKPHPVWDARAAHLEGQAAPPALDLRGTPAGQWASYDPASGNPGLAEPGAPWLPPLHPETTKAVAWELRVAQPLLQFMMFIAAALLLLNLVLAWDMIWTPVPAWLFWAAHGFDVFPVQQCLGVWL